MNELRETLLSPSPRGLRPSDESFTSRLPEIHSGGRRGDRAKNVTAQVVHVEGDPDHPTNRGTLCPKGSSLQQEIMNDRRLLKPQVRRPGGTDWQDISWDDAINEIAARVKKTRDETFVEKDAAGHTVNRFESMAWIGGCTDTNEFNYLVVKAMHALGVVHLENQARV